MKIKGKPTLTSFSKHSLSKNFSKKLAILIITITTITCSFAAENNNSTTKTCESTHNSTTNTCAQPHDSTCNTCVNQESEEENWHPYDKEIFSQVKVGFRINDLGKKSFAIHEKVIRIFEQAGVPLTVAIIPKSFEEGIKDGTITQHQLTWLRDLAARGVIEIAQNGYTHTINYQNDHFKSEFFKMDSTKQLQLIEQGRQIIQHYTGVTPTTFIPPWNTYDKNTTSALVKLGYNTISGVRYGFYSTKERQLTYIPYTCYIQNILQSIGTINKQIASHPSQITPAERTTIAVLHFYDFQEGNTQPVENHRKPISYERLQSIIREVKKCNNVTTLQLQGFTHLPICYDNIKFRNSSQPDFLLPLPSFFSSHSLSTYYKDVPLYKRLRNFYIEIFYYIFLISIGAVAHTITKRLPWERTKKTLAFIAAATTIASIFGLFIHNDSTKIIFIFVISLSYTFSHILNCYLKKLCDQESK